ncbi:MAG: response regulator [Candidatus Omnitrophica bacterium]|nr:response regulator [Candidatus Omnitrophota bacterium]
MTEKKKRVVIAEDNLDLCDILKTILSGEGYTVDTVHDGTALISFLQENQDVDVVILDLIMPERGGITIFDTVRAIAPEAKLLIYTGYTSYRHSVFAREADAFLSKTDGPEILLQTIRDLTR